VGNKDQQWKEAPGYCVECYTLKPLNSSAVCEDCYSENHLTDYEMWGEDTGKSQEYYKGLESKREDSET